jgi:type III polyketide synthase
VSEPLVVLQSHLTDHPGFRTVLTRDVPSLTKAAVKPMFEKLTYEHALATTGPVTRKDDFDWALHPGGEAVIDNVKDTMGLTEHQLRATREIYKTRGNSSSPTVLIVLDKLRSMGRGSDQVIAASFGPGLTIEMAMLRRCREVEAEAEAENDFSVKIPSGDEVRVDGLFPASRA